MPLEYCGWDLGGAHLKLARLDAGGDILSVTQQPCPLWNGIGELDNALVGLRGEVGSQDTLHAITMTGELCDVFANRREGVEQIVSCFKRVFEASDVLVYGGYNGWLALDRVMSDAVSVASANWLALAAFVAERVPNSVVLDVGSTTADIILVCAGEVRAAGTNDADRLAKDELLYTGVVRTPVMAVCDRVPYGGRWQNIASENFATMADVYRLLGLLHDGDDQMPTADAQPKDLFSSARRLARMLGFDYEADQFKAIVRVAQYVADCQFERVQRAAACALSRTGEKEEINTIVGAGVGAFVLERLAEYKGMDFLEFASVARAPENLRRQANNCAPAVCVAKLAWVTH